MKKTLVLSLSLISVALVAPIAHGMEVKSRLYRH